MTDDGDQRQRARELVGKALIPDAGQGGIAGAFDQLETRLRQPYARALTADDLDDIRSYLTARMDVIFELLAPRPPRLRLVRRRGPYVRGSETK
jgi:hypothetical protein